MEPKTLQDGILFFSEPVNCREYLVARRWPDGVECPKCGSTNVTFYEKYNRWHCREKHAAPQFTLKTGTVMEDSPIGLDKWLTAMWMVVNCKNGVSSWEMHRTLGITQKSAWFMNHRIREALKNGTILKLGGSGSPVEVDETFNGGKAKNMHTAKRKRVITRRGAHDKTIVFGMLERGGKVKAKVIPNRMGKTVEPILAEHVEAGSAIHTDEMTGYTNLRETYLHEVVNHAVEYVSGQVHTNGMENFWSLLKRGINGTYVAIEPFHLDRYLDEQVFRYNNRATKKQNMTDADRLNLAVSQIVGKRLTYAELTGKVSRSSEQLPC
jgi:transposase-like protein